MYYRLTPTQILGFRKFPLHIERQQYQSQIWNLVYQTRGLPRSNHRRRPIQHCVRAQPNAPCQLVEALAFRPFGFQAMPGQPSEVDQHQARRGLRLTLFSLSEHVDEVAPTPTQYCQLRFLISRPTPAHQHQQHATQIRNLDLEFVRDTQRPFRFLTPFQVYLHSASQ